MDDRVNLGAAIHVYCHDCFGNLSFIQKEIRKSKYVSRFFLHTIFTPYSHAVPLDFQRLGLELLVCCLSRWGSTGVFLFLCIFSKLFGARRSPSSGSLQLT